MANTIEGRIKSTASKLGISVEQYKKNKSEGLKWCSTCKKWLDIKHFVSDASRGDGLSTKCVYCTKSIYHKKHVPKVKKSRVGIRLNPVRDGDRKQARHWVNHLIDCNRIPKPNSLPCNDCGHIYIEGDKRHEYHHYLGYEAINHEKIICLCSSCHHKYHPFDYTKRKNPKNKNNE